jgi:hypothetical protein
MSAFPFQEINNVLLPLGLDACIYHGRVQLFSDFVDPSPLGRTPFVLQYSVQYLFWVEGK